VLYGFRKACRIWTSQQKLPRPLTDQSSSGIYDTLQERNSQTGQLVRLDSEASLATPISPCSELPPELQCLDLTGCSSSREQLGHSAAGSSVSYSSDGDTAIKPLLWSFHNQPSISGETLAQRRVSFAPQPGPSRCLRLAPREYPQSESKVTTPAVEPLEANDLIDLTSLPSFKTVESQTSSSDGDEPKPPLVKSSSTPGLFMKSTWAINTSVSTSSSSVSHCEVTELPSLHRSIHQLLTVSSCDTRSWEIDIPVTQELEETSTGQESIEKLEENHQELDADSENQLESESVDMESVITEESDGHENTLARLFNNLSSNSDQHFSEETLARLFQEPSSTSQLSDNDIDESALIRLFQRIASQTSKVSTNFSNIGRLLGQGVGSEATLARLFKETSALSAETSESIATLSDIASSHSMDKTPSTLSLEQDSQSTVWSDAKSPKLSNTSLPEALLTLTQTALSTSFNVSDSKVIDLPSLMETLKHVTSLLASSHAILDLSLSTLREKLAAQPSEICVCPCQQASNKLHSEPLLVHKS